AEPEVVSGPVPATVDGLHVGPATRHGPGEPRPPGADVVDDVRDDRRPGRRHGRVTDQIGDHDASAAGSAVAGSAAGGSGSFPPTAAYRSRATVASASTISPSWRACLISAHSGR